MTDTKNPGPEANPTAGKAKVRPLEVVLVDDSELIRRRLAASVAAVSGVGTIREAHDVPAGLRLLEVAEPDVLVLDIEMPGQSGIDLLKIAKRRAYASVVIMLSVHDHPVLRQKCLDLGADFYFHKLTEFDKVATVCQEMVDHMRQLASQ